MTGMVPPGPGQPPEQEPVGSPPPQPPPPYGAPDSFRNRAEEYTRASTSKKMAGWGLGLSLLICIPFAPLVGLGLGIAVLVRSAAINTPGQDQGKGLAIGAVVVGGIYVLVFVGLVVFGVVEGIREGFDDDPERDEAGEVTEPTDIPALNLRVGDCANDPDLVELGPDETGETYELEAVPCRLLHDFEVFYGFDLPDGDYPGEEAIFREAEKQCGQEARKFLGGLKGAARLGVSYYFPKEASWRLYDDRKVLCVIAETGEKTVGSLEGTGRR